MATGALTETVAEELETAAAVTRRIDGRLISSFVVGVGLGVGIGFYIGYRYNKKKLRAEIYAEADNEIEEIREHYHRKEIALEAQDKIPVQELVKEKGYVSENEETPVPEFSRLEDPGAEPDLSRISSPVPLSSPPQGLVAVPYEIDEDTFNRGETGYSQVAYIYYSEDDVLVEEENPETILFNRETLIGEDILSRFDEDGVVYVRNPNLQHDFEIHRSPLSWARDVAGQTDDESG